MIKYTSLIATRLKIDISKYLEKIVAKEEIRQITSVNVISRELANALNGFEIAYQDIGKHETVRYLRDE